jgi:peroxiredoxin
VAREGKMTAKENKKKSWKEKQRDMQTKQQQSQEAYRRQREQEAKNRPKKLPKGKIIFGVSLVAIVLLSFGAWQFSGAQPSSAPGEETASPSPNTTAPNFSLKDINGTSISLNQYSGRPVLVHFMALAGCSGQLNEVSYTKLPQLNSVSSKYSDKVAIVTVSVATCAGCDTILANLRKDLGISWVLGNDYDDQRLDIVDSYADYEIYDGTIVLIDRSFNVAQVYNPDATLDMITSRIDQLL